MLEQVYGVVHYHCDGDSFVWLAVVLLFFKGEEMVTMQCCPSPYDRVCVQSVLMFIQCD